MSIQAGRSIGIALLMAAAMLAALFAMGVFTPSGVSGHNAATANVDIRFGFDDQNLDSNPNDNNRARNAYEWVIDEGETDATFDGIALINNAMGDVLLNHRAGGTAPNDHPRIQVTVDSVTGFTGGTDTSAVSTDFVASGTDIIENSGSATLLPNFHINTNTGLLSYDGPKLNFEAPVAELADISADDSTADPPTKGIPGKQLVKLRVTVSATGTAPAVDAVTTPLRNAQTATVVASTLADGLESITSSDDEVTYTTSVDVWVTLRDVNDAPTIDDTTDDGDPSQVITYQIEENTPGRGVDEDNRPHEPQEVARITAEDVDMLAKPRPDGTTFTDTLMWSISGPDSDDFRIAPDPADNTNGNRDAEITYVGDGLNYEDYRQAKCDTTGMGSGTGTTECTDDISLTVTVDDQNGGMVMKKVTIDVRDSGVPEPPMAPMTLMVDRVTGSDTDLVVSWDSPMNPGPTITKYEVQYQAVGATTWTRARSVTIGENHPDTDENALDNDEGRRVKIENLITGTPYVVQVRARNDDTPARSPDEGGASSWSASSDEIEPAGTPTMPLNVDVVSGNRELAVTWATPTDNGGLPITGYEVRHQATGFDVWVSTTVAANVDSHTIVSLVNGTSYQVQVRAQNAVGNGALSSPIARTPVGGASSPVNLTLSPSQSNVLVNWTEPANNGGQPITGYDVRYRFGSADYGDAVTVTGTSHEIMFPTHTSPRTITVEVSANNGTAHTGSPATQQARIPSAPAGLLPGTNKLPTDFEAVSSDIPGAGVRVTLKAMLTKSLDERIAIKLDKFGLPSSIEANRVTIRSNDGQAHFQANPTDVTVSGSTVTLVLGSPLTGVSDSTQTLSGLLGDKVTTITIQQSAGITNPTEAKTYDLEVGGNTTTNKATVNRKITVKPDSGPRGTEITVTGKGFASGDAQVLLIKKAANVNVGDPVAITDGAFELVIETGTSFDAGSNTINASDSAGNMATNGAMFEIKPKITVSPADVAIAQKLTITLSDWPHGKVDTVQFAGVTGRTTPTTSTYDADDKSGKVEVTVPQGTRRGQVNVDLYVGKAKQGTAIAMVGTLGLSVSPSASVVPGQSVTITGSDFGKAVDVSSVKIGGKAATVPSDARSTSTGRVSVTVDVPLTVGHGDKEIEVMIGSMTGVGTLTVVKPAITVAPEESLPGSIIAVTGTGFASNGRIEVFYDGGIEAVGRADSGGNVSVRFAVPSGAGIGETNKVKVEVRGTTTINASADHKTPGAMLVLPERGQAGGTITIKGHNFAPFSTLSEVMIGNQNAKPSPAPETDKNGTFEFEARVPRLAAGSHTVTVKDGSTDENSATETFTVVTTALLYTPEEVFGDLIDAGVLGSVWRYSIDETGSDWDSYDPQFVDEPGINDLEFVSKGDIVWIRVTENVADFQGARLYAGWNLITLE